MASKLFTPLQVGQIGTLRHRVVLAPLTRNRASEPSLAPSALTVQYYRQRASLGGLLITEATHISPESLAYPSTPGLWSSDQTDGWRKVSEAVHEKGGFLVCQLWHTGRVAHPSFGQHPSNSNNNSRDFIEYTPCVSASPTPIVNKLGKRGKTMTYGGRIRDHEMPKELSRQDITRLCRDYARAARNAKDAGFDGIEIHSAHGYLIDQFLNDGVNKRSDEYGGSVENRCRLLREVIEAVLEVWPSGKLGVRLSPHDAPNGGNTYYGCQDSDPDSIYTHAIKILNGYNLAYLLLTEPRWVGKYDSDHATDPGYQMPLINLEKFRSIYNGVMIGAGGFTPSSSYDACKMSNGYDAIAFGRWYISNPDLPRRLKAWHEYESRGRLGALPPPLNRYERDTFYSQDADGYIDYPSLAFGEDNFQTQEAVSKQDFQGMELGKYELVDQGHVGKTLKSTDQIRSKL